MVMLESMTLDGCAPTPLASYLKALGVLRLISSDASHVDGRAADPKARGWWEGERFHVRTTLDRAALCGFFLNDYALGRAHWAGTRYRQLRALLTHPARQQDALSGDSTRSVQCADPPAHGFDCGP